MNFPPLPEIQSQDIFLQVYTHRSVFGRPVHRFEDPPNDPAPDNESLEHLGDSVLGFIITTLIRDMYPHIHVGPATKIRARVVGNQTLAALAVGYKMHNALRTHPSQSVVLRTQTNIQADIFESYVAGVYLTRGIEDTREWISALFRPYIEKAYDIVRSQYYLPPSEPSSVSPSPKSSPVEALPPCSESKSPVLTDIMNTLDAIDLNTTPLPNCEGHSEARIVPTATTPPVPQTTPTAPGQLPHGYLMLFNDYINKKKLDVIWCWESSKNFNGTAEPFWEGQIFLNEECIGSGRARDKKTAKNAAALKALEKLGLLDQA